MLLALLLALAVFCAFQAIRVTRLMSTAIWLAGLSALLALVFTLMGARTVAVIELSVGAGLVTVLFVFAISVVGDPSVPEKPPLPRLVAGGLLLALTLLAGWMTLPGAGLDAAGAEGSLGDMLWAQRGLDVLVQIVLIFAGVLGMLSLLSEAKAPLDHPMADEYAVKRDQAIAALAHPVEIREQERELERS